MVSVLGESCLRVATLKPMTSPTYAWSNLRKNRIEMVRETGILTADGSHELDVFIFATGFDAVTGAFKAIDWHLKDYRPLIRVSDDPDIERALWPNHNPKTFLGITVPAMPNAFMILGPHQPFGNATRSTEHAVDVVVVEILQHCKDSNISYVEPTEHAVEEWTDHVAECGKGALSNEVDSWMTGVNTNVRGKNVKSVARYAGSAIEYRRRCEQCRMNGWNGLRFE